MRELSMHIMDIVENGIRANADFISITIIEDTDENLLTIMIEDNGCGIDEEILKDITDPFITSRSERRVGMGLSLFKEASERCQGAFNINSSSNGTFVSASFEHDHIDRAPLGAISETLMAIIPGASGIDLEYKHIYNKKDFIFNTKDIKEVLGDDSLTDPVVLAKLRETINEAVKELKKGID